MDHVEPKDLETLESVAELALSLARERGAAQAETAVSLDAGLSVTVRNGEVETLEHQRDRGLAVTVYLDGRKGSASTAAFGREAVAATVEKACTIARYTAKDECAGLADASLMAEDPPDLDLYHPWSVTVEEAIEIARAGEAAALGTDRRLTNSEGGSVGTGTAARVYGNSHGFLGGYLSSHHSISCVVLGEENGGMERDYWYAASRDWRELEPAELVGRTAAERTLRRLGPRRLKTRHAPVIFPPELARGLVGHFVAGLRGSAQYRRASFLLDASGERIFPEWVTMREEPHLPKGPGSAAFDQEGVATRPRALVADGVVGGYVLSSYSARKLGTVTTGNAGGVHNLLVGPNAGGLDALVGQMGEGLLIGEVMGQGVNLVTGDYSRGASGFWVEGGQIAYPVSEITVAGNLRDMFARLVAAGDDVDRRGVIQCGSLLIEDMTIAGE